VTSAWCAWHKTSRPPTPWRSGFRWWWQPGPYPAPLRGLMWLTSQSRRSAVQPSLWHLYFARRLAADLAKRQMWLRCHSRAHLFEHHVRRRVDSMTVLQSWHRPGLPFHCPSGQEILSSTSDTICEFELVCRVLSRWRFRRSRCLCRRRRWMLESF